MTALSVPSSDADDPVGDLAQLVLAMTPEQLETFASTLDPDDMAALEQVMAQRAAMGWRTDPATMAAHLTAGKFKLWRYVKLLSQKFVDAVEGRSPRQIWNLPSRMGKSVLASQWGPTWCFDRHPEANIILTSYGDDLANKNAIAVRDNLEQYAGVLRTRLRRDQRRMDRFVTEHGGGLLAAGINSAIVGFGAGNGGGIVIDDPFKNWPEAHRETVRDNVWDQFRGVLRLRLDSDDAWIVTIQTRWHESDLTGKLVQFSEDETGEAWELVRLPAIAEAPQPDSLDPILRLPDPLGRAPGEVLEPERFSLEAVRGRSLVLGSYLSAALEQQRPSPEEGGDLKRGWWQWADALPPKFDEVISSTDTKLKDKQAGDFVVIQVWGRTGTDYWLLEQLRGQWDQATTKLAIALATVRHPQINRHYVENTGNGPEVMTELRRPNPAYEVRPEMAGNLGMTKDEQQAVERLIRRGVPKMIPVNVKGDKRVRARAESGLLEAGHVHLLNNDPGALVLVEEASAFPQGTHDDCVDAWSQAMSKLSGGGGRLAVPTGTITKPPINTRAQAMPQRSRVMLPGPRPRQ